ncbi:hypothetical protein ADK38_43480, partial [Streptomyces varsoviensis]
VRPAELPGVASMVGFFINTVPVRVPLDGAQPLSEMLTGLQRRQSALRAHQHLGLSEINQLAGTGAAFDTLVVYENYPRPPAGPPRPDAFAISHAGATEAAHYPLTLAAVPGDRMLCKLDYRPDVYDRATAESVLRRLIRVLEQMAADPTAPVGRIDALTPEERARVVAGWNATADPTPTATVPELIAGQALRTPGAVAVSSDEHTLTYAELSAASDRLAGYLSGLGVGRGDRVAVLMERSAELLVALLGVWKAGAAYVPVDVGYPAERVAFMLADSGPAAVVCTVRGRDVVPVDAPGRLVVLDDPRVAAEVAGCPAEGAPVVVGAEDLAYVMYTSG